MEYNSISGEFQMFRYLGKWKDNRFWRRKMMMMVATVVSVDLDLASHQLPRGVRVRGGGAASGRSEGLRLIPGELTATKALLHPDTPQPPGKCPLFQNTS